LILFVYTLYTTDTDCKQQATVLLKNVKCQMQKGDGGLIARDFDEIVTR
jgi:hypothetical protein